MSEFLYGREYAIKIRRYIEVNDLYLVSSNLNYLDGIETNYYYYTNAEVRDAHILEMRRDGWFVEIKLDEKKELWTGKTRLRDGLDEPVWVYQVLYKRQVVDILIDARQ